MNEYSLAKVQLITYAKTENVISWKIDFMQVQKENHSYDRSLVINCTDSLSTYCEVPGGSRLQRKEYGQICPKRKIFRQKR